MKRIIIFLIITVLYLHTGLTALNYHPDLSEEQYVKLFNEAINLVKDNYVDTDKIDLEKLYYGAINGMIKTLDDPYTRFMPAQSYDDMKTKTTGKFGGLGIVITIKDKMLTIVSPIYGTPAYRKNVRPGDKIIEIDGKTTKDIKLDEAVEKLRGIPGTDVTITILRNFVDEPFDITITREVIEIKSIQQTMLEDDIGYIRIIDFKEDTLKELRKALNKLKEKGMTKLILDLRNNPGGLLSSAYAVSDMFLDHELVVYTRGRITMQNKDYYARKRGSDITTKIIVLVNGGSASGSEIVTGALKDNKRALIVGEKTFGKGSVQSVFPFKRVREAKAGIAVTTAYYYTPSGKLIHHIGIEPDITIKPRSISDDEAKMLIKFLNKDYALHFVEKHPDYTDTDVQNFMKTLKKDEITLKESIVRSRIKEQVARTKGKHFVGDLENDEQLIEAVRLFKAYDIFGGPIELNRPEK